MNRQTDGQMDRSTDGLMDGQTDGQTERWTNGQTLTVQQRANIVGTHSFVHTDLHIMVIKCGTIVVDCN